MIRFVAIIALVVMLSGIASALDYEDKPDIAVSFYGSNYFQRGDEKTMVLTVYNDAKNVKIEYSNQMEAGFFTGRENMLFTAYNVELTLEGDEWIEVKTPTQKIPALPPMQPITMTFTLKIADAAEAGEYVLNLKAEYYRLNSLKELVPYTNPGNPTEPPLVPEQVQYEVINGVETGNGTKVYVYRQMTEKYELEYIKVTETIPVTVYVEEKPVTLEVLKTVSENLIGKGKGKITVTVKNVGGKTARNAYLILDTPSGIEAESLNFEPESSASISGMPSIPGMPMTPTTMVPGMGMGGGIPQSSPLSAAKAAYYIGDLKPGETANATFYLKLNVKDGGRYPLHIKAAYLDEYGRLTESDSTTFGIDVRDAPKINVEKVESRVYANAKGELRVTLVSDTDLEDVTVRILASSPLSVLSSEYYVGDVKANRDFEAVFKLKASSEAKPVTYPADITVAFKSMNEYVELDPVKIGVKVNPKMEFEVIGQPSVAAGESKVVTFKIKNTGKFEIKDATARITIVDPFSSSDDSAFIGDLKPGETANASFKISVDRDATPKLYALNLEVKYKDPEGEWAISEPAKAVISVTPAKPPYILYGIVTAVIIAAVIIYFKRR